MRSSALQLVATVGAFLLLTTIGVRGGARVEEVAAAPAVTAMPAAQVNALAQSHCVVCHQGATPGGGLAFDGFDVARVDPIVARMMLIKIEKDGALTASGLPRPDPAT